MLFRVGLIVLSGMLWVARCEAAETRVALIIGNSNYQVSRLKLGNPANDAAAMQKALQLAGFETILKINATRRDIYHAVDEFSARIARDPHAVGLFYYAGHGVQAEGTNYLIPVDAEIESEVDLDASAYDVGKVLQAMAKAQNEMNIVILDACRDNPLPKTRGVDRGLARMNAPSGTFIAYAAAPGQVAHDGQSGANGVFTGELIKAMAVPNVPLEQIFKRVIIGVKADTHNEQQPWTEASIQGDFYFRTTAAAAPAAALVSTTNFKPETPATAQTRAALIATPAPAPGVHVPTRVELDEIYWQGIRSSTDLVDYQMYNKSFPGGLHAAEADHMLRKLAPTAQAAAAPAQQVPHTNTPAPAASNVSAGPPPANGTGSPPQADTLSRKEMEDFGVPATPHLHMGTMHEPTPTTIPGGRVITTQQLVAGMKSQNASYLLLDALGNAQTLPNAVPVAWASDGGNLGDNIEQRLGQLLNQRTGGNRNMALIFYCLSNHCWMSYNAALRAIDLGYRNVYWYRGGIEAWTEAGLPTRPAASY